MTSPTRPEIRRVLTGVGLLAGILSISVGCSQPKREITRAAAPVVNRDIPSALRGTIGSECTFRGIEPVLVSGFGIVVGLNGTGGGFIDPAVRATMERELARGGVTRANTSNGEIGKSPDEFLRDPNVAVVIVEAAIPPGAPRGANFDVRVRALPNSGVTSLEGGILWTAPLRIGPATTMTGIKTRMIAEARGPIFINPFVEPGAAERDGVSRDVGRILNGGVVTQPLKIEIALDNESHTRARAIVAAINTRFPQGPYDDDPIALGRSASSVALAVPAAYRQRPADFLGLIRHLSIDQSFQQERARQYVQSMKTNPELSGDLAWCLRAVGTPAIPFVREMYDYAQVAPRLSALDAGAKLGDMRTLPHLIRIAKDGPPGFRVPAIQLIAELPTNEEANAALRELVNATTLDVRVAAYEGLVKRADYSIDRVVVGDNPRYPKFYIDLVPAKEPLIYITQQGEPRIVLFGGSGVGFGARRDSIRLDKPLFVSAWSDRLLINAESAESPVKVYYQDVRTGRKVQENVAPEQLAAFLQYAAHTPTPEDPTPGLSLSYSETVGALYELHRQAGVQALFATEEDRLRAAVWDAARSGLVEERPEISADEPASGPAKVFEPQAPTQPSASAEGETAGGKPTLIQPLKRKEKKK